MSGVYTYLYCTVAVETDTGKPLGKPTDHSAAMYQRARQGVGRYLQKYVTSQARLVSNLNTLIYSCHGKCPYQILSQVTQKKFLQPIQIRQIETG